MTSDITRKAREFLVWRTLRRGAQNHEEVAEQSALPINEVKAIIRRKGWLFEELPQRTLEEVDNLPEREMFRDPPWEIEE